MSNRANNNIKSKVLETELDHKPARDDGAGSFRAGAAKSEITNGEPGNSVGDPLYAKALVLDDGHTRAVIIAMDVTAIGGRAISDGMLPDVGEDFLPRLRERIRRELRIPEKNVLVNASHTHPPGRMLCSDDEQVERAFEAVRQATENMVEARVGSGIGHETRIAINRTLRLKNGKHWTIRHTNPSPPEDEIVGAGPVDTDVGVIRFDRLDGTPLAVIYNFACHLLFGDYQGHITANFPGYASKIIEERLGHGSMALFLQGAAGDVCDVGFKDFTRRRDIAELGSYLAQTVLETADGVVANSTSLAVVSKTVDLPRRSDIPKRIEALKREQRQLLASLRFTSLNFQTFLPLYLESAGPDEKGSSSIFLNDASTDKERDSMDSFNRKNIDKYLRNLRAMDTLARIEDDIATLEKHCRLNSESGETAVSAEVMAARIGDSLLIAAPFEALTQIGLNIKQASPLPHTFVAAYTNGYLHYGAPADYYDNGGYEVTECLLAPEWENIFMNTVRAIFEQLEER